MINFLSRICRVNNCVGENNQKYFVLFTVCLEFSTKISIILKLINDFSMHFVQFYIAMISAHAMFLAVNQFAQCIKHEWKQCSSFSPPATVILLLFLTFEALLFAVFTLIMLGSQMNAIWNDETVRSIITWNGKRLTSNSFTVFPHFSPAGYRTIEKRRSELDEKIPLEKYSSSIWQILIGLVFAVHKANNQIENRSKFLFCVNLCHPSQSKPSISL